MHGLRGVVIAGIGATLPSVVHADPIEVGAFVGPRIWAADQMLGYIEEAPAHPALIGGRVGTALLPWLVPEIELVMTPTSTTPEGGASSVDVFFFEPRAHLRLMLSEKRLQPFGIVGVGAPVALSSGRKTFDSGIVGAFYVGGGVRFDTNQGFSLRGDARVGFVPGAAFVTDDDSTSYVKVEIDVGVGVEIALGKPRVRAKKEGPAPIADPDKDGIIGAKDACPDRAEDADGFEDLDGCPDIDNDNDRVLDIAIAARPCSSPSTVFRMTMAAPTPCRPTSTRCAARSKV